MGSLLRFPRPGPPVGVQAEYVAGPAWLAVRLRPTPLYAPTVQLGKKPAAPSPSDFKMATYFADVSKLKAAPVGFTHANLVTSPWGMLGNDRWGDCVAAEAAHGTMLWNAAAGRQVKFTDAGVLAFYSAVTGFDPHAGPPGGNPTDQGTNMGEALAYRRKVGIADSNGALHRVGAYLSISPKSFGELLQALYLFEAVAIGFEFPESAMTQFGQGKPWTVVKGSQIVGGHDVLIEGRPNAEGLDVVTWGRRQRMSRGFYEAYNDEAWAIVSPEMLSAAGRSLEGFDVAALEADLGRLTAPRGHGSFQQEYADGKRRAHEARASSAAAHREARA